MDRTNVDLPDVSYSDGDRELLASPSPSMRRGVSTSSGPRPSRQSQQNVLVVQTTESAADTLPPANAGEDVEEADRVRDVDKVAAKTKAGGGPAPQ